MIEKRTRSFAVGSLGMVIFTLLLAVPGMAAAAEDSPGPEALAQRFMELFQQKDLGTISGLFAPGALVQRARLGDAAPEYARFDAQAWAQDAQDGISAVEDFKMEVLDITSLGFGEGTTVTVHFRATGRVGENLYFINNGVDSFSFTQIDGSWKILLYNSMERLEFGS